MGRIPKLVRPPATSNAQRALSQHRWACVPWLAVVVVLAGCSGGPPPVEHGWVNLAVAAETATGSAGFFSEYQACDVQEVSDCVVARCQPQPSAARIDAGVVHITGAALDIELDTDPAQLAEPGAWVSTEVESRLTAGESIDFELSGSARVPRASRALAVPEAISVDVCAQWPEPAAPRWAEARDVTLVWPAGTPGELLVRLVSPGVEVREPHVRPELVAICQFAAANGRATVQASVMEFMGVDEVELHVDLVSLAVLDLDSRSVAFSVSRDVCRSQTP